MVIYLVIPWLRNVVPVGNFSTTTNISHFRTGWNEDK